MSSTSKTSRRVSDKLGQSLLYRVLEKLTPLERKHLGQWLASPFFCRRAEPGLLYGYLSRCVEQEALPGEDAAWEAVWGAQRVERQALRLLMSELLGQVERFFMFQESMDAELGGQSALAAAYRKRSLAQHFERAVRRGRVRWAARPFRDMAYFEAQAALEFEEYQFQSSGQRTKAFKLQSLFDATDAAFALRKLRQGCFALSHRGVFQAEYDLGLLHAVVAEVRRRPALHDLPAVGLYYHCYLFLTEPAEEGHFHHFKHLLFEHSALLPPDERRDLYLLAINYCIRKFNQSINAYFREALDLYQSALAQALLLENGLLSPFAFNNIAAIALRLGEWDWAEAFIHEYAAYLEPRHRDKHVGLNLARLAYARRDYRRALLHLQEADYKDLLHNLMAKTLQLKIFYETGAFETLDAHLNSMQAFLRRHRGLEYHRDNYLNVVRFTRKLMQLMPGDKAEREKIAKEVAEANPLTEREWLLGKIG